jgi:hypothetical protein
MNHILSKKNLNMKGSSDKAAVIKGSTDTNNQTTRQLKKNKNFH